MWLLSYLQSASVWPEEVRAGFVRAQYQFYYPRFLDFLSSDLRKQNFKFLTKSPHNIFFVSVHVYKYPRSWPKFMTVPTSHRLHSVIYKATHMFTAVCIHIYFGVCQILFSVWNNKNKVKKDTGLLLPNWCITHYDGVHVTCDTCSVIPSTGFW